MTVHLHNIPTTNTLAVRVSLVNGAGNIVATLNAGAAQVLNCGFDSILLVNPGLPPVARNQHTVGNFAAHPGNVAFFENAAGPGVNLCYAQPGGVQTTVNYQ